MSIQKSNKKIVRLLLISFLFLATSSGLFLFLNILFLGFLLVLAALGILMVALFLMMLPLLKFAFSSR
jgi:hypothetical protein